MAKQLIEIHTSDRGTYKRCRRRFGWGSTLRDNLVRVGPDQKAFFLGTGFHFALEDYWGYRRFEHPAMAFAAYFDAQKNSDLPDEADDVLELAVGMLSYYVDEFLPEHPERFETLWIEGVPQVEVEVAIDLNGILLEEIEGRCHFYGEQFPGRFDRVVQVIKDSDVEYVMTFDRVCIDRHERILGLDYKTAATFDELNLQTNPQSASYNWGLDLFYKPHGYTVEGIIWQQHWKHLPGEIKVVNVGKVNEGLSLDIRVPTTYRLYKKALREYLGPKKAIPQKYLDHLAILAGAQGDEGDRFVRREVLRLNQQQRENEQRKIVAEVLEMLDPDLVLYPNPTKDCSWDCAFKAPCLSMDEGSDFQHLLSSEYTPWQGYKDDWRQRVKYPVA